MITAILIAVMGVVCIGLGISLRKGNTALLHDYHTTHVSEKDRLPLGKRTGLGVIIIGTAIVIYGAVMGVTLVTEAEILSWIGLGVLGAGLVAGLVLTVSALKKYNGGMF